jgi:Zn-dependent M28 family amino/carboxypeptidase
MMSIKTIKKTFPIVVILFIFLGSCSNLGNEADKSFNAEQAYNDIQYQLSFGPRIVGSKGHNQVGDWIITELKNSGWEVEIQELVYKGHPIRNIIGKYGSGEQLILIGAHYDTRAVADNDPFVENRTLPVPGANDGASGVAVLLELSRRLPKLLEQEDSASKKQIWLVFFDAEDNGNIPGWEWSLGSQAFVQELDVRPNAVIIVDMVGDKELNICYEGNSNEELQASIWNKADMLGYEEYFDAERVCYILDDHTAFVKAGIPSVDIIDIDYTYWHTVDDTIDKVSPGSLRVVGQTLLKWITEN